MRTRSLVSWFVSPTLVVTGLALVVIYFTGQDPASTVTNSDVGSGNFDVPEVAATQDKPLKLTVLRMSRIKADTIPDAAGDDEREKANAAIHLKGTGFPWQREANAYMAGHRPEYPGTDSFLTFYDLNELEKSDKAFVTDSEGTKYTYEVYKRFIVDPDDLWVTEPVEGKNTLTLQTCTLPDYSRKVIVQAELVAVAWRSRI